MADRVVPARITMALDAGGHEGPGVDVACGTWEGNPDGDVDGWEAAAAAPTAEQVWLLSVLTGFPVPWFYRPVVTGPTLGPVTICSRTGRRGERCRTVEPSVVDDRGVLHYGGEPRRTAGPAQGALF